MEATPRTRIVYFFLVLLALILGWITTNFFEPYTRLPVWLRLALISLPSVFLPFVIGWINPDRWWLGLVGALAPTITGISALFAAPRSLPDEQLGIALRFLPLIISYLSVSLGRWLARRRQQRILTVSSSTAIVFDRWVIPLSLLLIVLSCAALWALIFLKIPVLVTLKEGQITAQPTVAKGWGGLQFQVENQGTQPHQFIVLISLKPIGPLQVSNGKAQLYENPGDQFGIPYDTLQRGGRVLWEPEESPPDGPPLQPGEKRTIQYGYSGMAMAAGPQTFTILCNLPGHYEKGEHITVTLTE